MVALQGASSLKLAHVVGPLPVARHNGHVGRRTEVGQIENTGKIVQIPNKAEKQAVEPSRQRLQCLFLLRRPFGVPVIVEFRDVRELKG